MGSLSLSLVTSKCWVSARARERRTVDRDKRSRYGEIYCRPGAVTPDHQACAESVGQTVHLFCWLVFIIRKLQGIDAILIFTLDSTRLTQYCINTVSNTISILYSLPTILVHLQYCQQYWFSTASILYCQVWKLVLMQYCINPFAISWWSSSTVHLSGRFWTYYLGEL